MLRSGLLGKPRLVQRRASASDVPLLDAVEAPALVDESDALLCGEMVSEATRKLTTGATLACECRGGRPRRSPSHSHLLQLLRVRGLLLLSLLALPRVRLSPLLVSRDPPLHLVDRSHRVARGRRREG